MITSFAAGGLLALTPGLAAMLGANVGTTIIVQLLSFNLTALAPTLILVGVWLFRRNQPSRRREIGRASWRERVCQYVWISVVAVSLKKKTNQKHDKSKNK